MTAADMAKDLASKWLASCMFAGDADGEQRAEKISARLSERDDSESRGRRIDQKTAKDWGSRCVAWSRIGS